MFQRLSSGPSGIDPYAAAVSDVYQDLFGEGSYTGKGIYDIDAFEEALAGRVPENTLLSHDLFEGLFARAGLVTDVELFESAPANYLVGRGAPAPLGARRLAAAAVDPARAAPGRGALEDDRQPAAHAVDAGRVSHAAARMGWPGAQPVLWSAFVLAVIAVPPMLAAARGRVPRVPGISKRSHVRAVARDFLAARRQVAFTLTIMAHQAWLMADADHAHARAACT